MPSLPKYIVSILNLQTMKQSKPLSLKRGRFYNLVFGVKYVLCDSLLLRLAGSTIPVPPYKDIPGRLRSFTSCGVMTENCSSPSVLCALETTNISVTWRRKGETPHSCQDTKRIPLQVSSTGLQPYQISKVLIFSFFVSKFAVHLVGFCLLLVFRLF